jgi:Na+/H+-dicarboxylate symporter
MGGIEGIVALVIGIAVVLFVPALVRATVMAGMGEVLRWAGDFSRAMVALMIMLTPGIVFWLVVIGIIAIIHRLSRTGLYQIVRDEIWENLKAFARKVAATVSTK